MTVPCTPMHRPLRAGVELDLHEPSRVGECHISCIAAGVSNWIWTVTSAPPWYKGPSGNL